MSYGIIAVSQDNTYLLHSDTANGLFYKTAGTYVGTAPIASYNFLASFGVSTPISPVTWSTNNSIFNYISVCGEVSGDGLSYQQPTPAFLACNASNAANIPNPILTPSSAYVHSFGSLDYVEGYGFSCKGANSLAISSSNRAYCIHPASDGSRIRVATATSMTMPDFGNIAVASFNQPVDQNIYFDQAYTNPPLIFIVGSSGPIAMNFMNRDGNGKYVSASIIAKGSVSAPGGYKGIAFYSKNIYTFSYFIVSDEPPVHSISCNYGVKVFDASGMQAYDSSNFMPSFQAVSITSPYLSLDADGYYRQYAGSSFGTSGMFGVCINNLHAITGYGEYMSYNINGNGGGPISFFGRYLNVTPTAAVVTGEGTGAFIRSYLNYTTSFDFIKGVVPNVNILFANFNI